MSAMDFREPNEVLWRGVRPAHKGTQIVKVAQPTAQTLNVHEVSAGKTLFLTTASLSKWGNMGFGNLLVTNSGLTIQYYILIVESLTAVGHIATNPINFSPPLEIPAGWFVRCQATGAGSIAYGFIHGWEE